MSTIHRYNFVCDVSKLHMSPLNRKPIASANKKLEQYPLDQKI